MKLLSIVMLVGSLAFAGNHAQELEKLRQQGQKEGWTFEVGESSSLDIPLELKTGLKMSKDWRKSAKFTDPELPIELPAKFDWRDHDGVTAIKNQGSCGSCWAFGTIAAFESAIKLATGKEVSLSEQQLVSCQPSYGTCSGGDFALGFYKANGANHTEDFPYSAADVSCQSSAPQYEKIAGWGFVGDANGEPTNEQIKAAILKYGVVSTTVAATGSFQAYHSGVFNACSSGQINHLVALVGWSDDDKAWIMKNSWGTSWGEQGFMRIAYTAKDGKTKCSSIGSQVAYATYLAQ